MSFFHIDLISKSKTDTSLLPKCDECGLYKTCKSPMMPVSGEGKKKVLIVAEAPGETEDRRGYQLCGEAGMRLYTMLHELGIDMRKDCWLTNAVICCPTDKANRNRNPTKDERSACRPNLVKTLKELKPDVVIALGLPAIDAMVTLAWKSGEVDNVARWAGWKVPSRELSCWICPTYHPSYLLREKNRAAHLHVMKHLKAAFELKGKPYPNGVPDLNKKIRVIMDHKEAANEINHWTSHKSPVAFDYETTCLKPHGPHAQIICCSIGDSKSAFAFPWHGDAVWAMQKFIQSEVPKVCANVDFELSWTWQEFGHGINNIHGDTVLDAHWLDCRTGICSLKFQAFVLLGMPDYNSYLEPFMGDRSGGCNVPNRLKEVEPRVLLNYCAMDSLLEAMVSEKQLWKKQ